MPQQPLEKQSVSDLAHRFFLLLLNREASGTANTIVVAERSLTERMLARAPLPNFSLWLDTADPTYIYIAEAPVGDTGAMGNFRGIRVVKDATGNPLGKVEQATNFVWDTRGSATWL